MGLFSGVYSRTAGSADRVQAAQARARRDDANTRSASTTRRGVTVAEVRRGAAGQARPQG